MELNMGNGNKLHCVCPWVSKDSYTGLLSNQGEKSIHFYFIMVPSLRKSIKVWYSKAQYNKAFRLEDHTYKAFGLI